MFQTYIIGGRRAPATRFRGLGAKPPQLKDQYWEILFIITP